LQWTYALRRSAVADRWQIVPLPATICTPATRIIAGLFDTFDNRSKFNVALGIESQGFCVLPR